MGNRKFLSFELCSSVLLPIILLTACQSPPDAHFRPGGEAALGQFAELSAPPGSNAPTLKSVTLSNQFDFGWLKPSTELFTLGPGDRLEVELLGEPTSRSTTVVAPDGKIYFSLLPGIDVWGLTVADAKTQLENELSKYVREKPQLSMI